MLERWITQSLFEGTEAQDEYSFMQMPGAAEKIEQHRETFITESDFAWLSASGSNAVRIPVGYWVFDGDEPFTACITYLDWAIKMAEKYHLKVLIDLHAARGSQNGKDHSGRIGQAAWHKSDVYKSDTIATLIRIADRYKHSPALWGIGLLNEPSAGLLKYRALKRFYSQAYRELIKVARPGTYTVFSDGFMPKLFSGSVKAEEEYPVAMDIHWYQVGYTSFDAYFSLLTKRVRQIAALQAKQPVLIGEWSGMLSHESLTGNEEEEARIAERRHISLQLKTYEPALGWFYWTYKTEEAGVWNFRAQVEQGNLLLG